MVVVVAAPPPVPAQTWAASSKDILGHVAGWVLVECVSQNRRWNSLTDSDPMIVRGMELVDMMATNRGIMLGTIAATPGELLKCVQDMATATNAPSAPLPVPPPAPVVVEPVAPPAHVEPPHAA